MVFHGSNQSGDVHRSWSTHYCIKQTFCLASTYFSLGFRAAFYGATDACTIFVLYRNPFIKMSTNSCCEVQSKNLVFVLPNLSV